MVALFAGCINQKPDFDVVKFSFTRYGKNVIRYTINVQNNNVEISELDLNLKLIRDEQKIIGSYIDTAIIYQDSFLFEKKLAKALYSKINEIGYDSSKTITSNRFGKGWGFIFETINNSDTITINCGWPVRTDSLFQQEFQLLDAFFDLVIRKTSNKKCDSLTKYLYRSYGGKVQFNQISKSPQEFEIIGGINQNSLVRDSLLYLDFFTSLPKDELILIDLTFTSTFFDRLLIADNVYVFGYTNIAFHKENYSKARKEMDLFGNDTIWLKENRYKYGEYDYFHHKRMYELWLKYKDKNQFITRKEALKTIANKQLKQNAVEQ